MRDIGRKRKMIKYQMICPDCGVILKASIIMDAEGDILFECTNCGSVVASTSKYNIKEGAK